MNVTVNEDMRSLQLPPKFRTNKRHKYNNTVTDMALLKIGYASKNATPNFDKYRGEDYTSNSPSAPDEVGMTTDATNPGMMSDTQNDSMADHTARRNQRGVTNVSQVTSDFATSRIADTQRD